MQSPPFSPPRSPGSPRSPVTSPGVSRQVNAPQTISTLLAQEGAQRAIYPGGVDVILAVLGLGSTNGLQQVLLERFGSEDHMFRYITRIVQLDQSPEIKSKTGLFFDQSYSTLISQFYERLKEYVYMVQSDFEQRELSARRINRWIEEHSGFPNVISPDELYVPDVFKAIMLVVNTLWFKDNWTNKFRPENTQPEPFTQLSGSKVNLPTMQRTGWIQYFIQDETVGVRLPFEQGAAAEFVMGLPASSDFNQTFSYGTQREVELHLPKFEHQEEIDLIPLLTNGGYADLFQPGNLERIVADPDLMVSGMKQLIYVRFDEAGAEVRAVTYATAAIPMMVMMEPDRVVIKFDQPFHYRIVKDGLTLVDGYYNGE